MFNQTNIGINGDPFWEEPLLLTCRSGGGENSYNNNNRSNNDGFLVSGSHLEWIGRMNPFNGFLRSAGGDRQNGSSASSGRKSSVDGIFKEMDFARQSW